VGELADRNVGILSGVKRSRRTPTLRSASSPGRPAD